jgi:hypothetical protein
MSEAMTELLSAYSAEIQELAWQARGLILDMMPGALEQVDPSSKLIAYGYGRRYADLICAIALYKNYVNLMFSRGVELPDPEKLLVGTGKRARHVKLTTAADVANPALRALVVAAVSAQKRASET